MSDHDPQFPLPRYDNPFKFNQLTATPDGMNSARGRYGYNNPVCDHNIDDELYDSAYEREPDSDDDIPEYEPRDEEYGCCEEMRLNFSHFRNVMDEQWADVKESFKGVDYRKKFTSCFSMETLRNKLPILKWAPKYNTTDLQGDIIAGITVGLAVLPQSIAYVYLAELPAQYGLYSAFLGSILYVFLGTAKDIAFGPSALQCLLIPSFAKSPVKGDPTYAFVLTFFSGLVEIFMSIVGLGAIMDFISFPVIKAFTSAAAITIGMSQVKKWWGLKNIPSDFLRQLYYTLAKIPEVRLWDFFLGTICIFFLVFLKKLKEIKWKTKFEDLSIGMKILNKTMWILGTARSVIILIVAAIIAGLWRVKDGEEPFILIGYIPPGIPKFKTPPFSLYDPARNITIPLTTIVGDIGAGFIVLPLISLIEAMAIGKVFARKNNYKIDPNQELLVYGIGNFLTSFVQGVRITGTFSRTSVNAASGVRTPGAGILTGILVLLGLQFLTPLLYYIPQAALGVVIIMAVLDKISFHKLWIFWTTRRIDLIPWFVTFILGLVLGIEYGVIIGAGLSLLLLLYPATRPTIKVIKGKRGSLLLGSGEDDGAILVVEIDTGLMYPAVNYLKEKILNIGVKGTLPKAVIMEFSHVAVIDTTALQGVRELLEDFHKKGIQLIVCGLQDRVYEVFRRAQLRHFQEASSVRMAIDLIKGMRMEETKTDTSNGPAAEGGGTQFAMKLKKEADTNFVQKMVQAEDIQIEIADHIGDQQPPPPSGGRTNNIL